MKTINYFFCAVLIFFGFSFCSAQEFHGATSMAEFAGGMSSLKQFINQNIHNRLSGKDTITGIVTVGYIVNENGIVEHVKILRGINAECDSEAVRVAKMITGWKPAVQWGKPISIRVSMPVEFSLINNNIKDHDFIITGNVCSIANGVPIEGALILVKGTNIGTVTDKNGNYYIESVPAEEAELEFSSLGYGAKSEKIEKNRSINIELIPEDLFIEFPSD